MPVFVDDMRLEKNGKVWSLLGADSLSEMHEFARRIGLKRSWFEISANGIPHYSVTEYMRQRAVRMGAEELTTIEAYKRLLPLKMPVIKSPPVYTASDGLEIKFVVEDKEDE